MKFLLFNTAKFHGIRYRFVYTEFRQPSNENSSIQPITKNLLKLVLYFVVNTVHKYCKKTKEKYKRNGLCRGIPYRFVYTEFSIPSMKIEVFNHYKKS
jgi:hypothetical protein